MTKRIVLVGAGAMGSALIQGWSVSESCELFVVDPNQKGAYASIDELLAKINNDIKYGENEKKQHKKNLPNVIVFAIKPQIIESVLQQYKIFKNDNCLFISIAAGIPIGTMKKHLGNEALCIRVMPNLGATVLCSVSALYASDNLSQDQRNLVLDLFKCIGMAFWVDTEDKINGVTALSGSGPAYVFRFIESFVASAQKMGFDELISNAMVRQTVLGAIKLLEQSGAPGDWRRRVTSPGGTTEAAMAVLDSLDFDGVMDHAIQAAYHRAKELSTNIGES